MKKHLTAISITAIAIIIIAITAFSACTRKENTAETAEFNILGEWRYMISRDITNNSTYEEERLLYFPELSISRNYGSEGSVKVSLAGFDIIYGDIKKTNNNVYHFIANPMLEPDSVFNSEMVFAYDTGTDILGWEDNYMIRYFKRVEHISVETKETDSFNFFVDYIHHVDMIQLTQNREIIYFETYGHWDTSGKEKIIIYSNVDLHNFKIFNIGDDFLEGGEVNYTRDVLLSTFALEYVTYIPEGQPVEGIFFYTDDGKEHVYLLGYSGIDGRVAIIEMEIAAFSTFSTVTESEFYIYGPWRLEIDKLGNPYMFDPEKDPEP